MLSTGFPSLHQIHHLLTTFPPIPKQIDESSGKNRPRSTEANVDLGDDINIE